MAKVEKGTPEAIKFVESMAAVVGLQRDAIIEGLTKAWGLKMIAAKEPDGYWLYIGPLAGRWGRLQRTAGVRFGGLTKITRSDTTYLESGIAVRDLPATPRCTRVRCAL